MGLTARQQAFIDAYAGNAAEAARAAGYSVRTADRIGSRLLRNVEVARAIRERGDREAQPRIATRQERQRFWTETMVDAGADMVHRLKASELLGKSEADFTEKHEHSGGVSIRVINPYAERPDGG